MIMSLAVSDCVPPTSPCLLKGDLRQCIDHAKLLGFDGVELHLRNPATTDFPLIADYAASKEMKVTSICTGMACYADGHYMTNPDLEARKAAQDVLIGFLEGGAIMGGACVSFCLMKGPLPEPRLREQYKDILYESLLPVVEAAERVGADFTVEAANRFESTYLWTADETLEFVNRFKSDRVTIHLDTFHMNIEDKDMERAIRICKDKLGHFHFSDNDRRYPGHSHVDFKMVMDTLYDIGYAQNGVGAFEYWADPDGPTAARLGLEHIQQFVR